MNTSGTMSGSALSVGIAIVLEDRFSNPAGQVSSAIRKLQNEAKQAVTANLEAVKNISSNISFAFGEIARGMATAIVNSSEFIDTMTTVGAITEATQEQMKALENTALDLGYQTMLTSRDIASGMKYLAMAGNSAEQINALISPATYMGIAGGLDVGGKQGAADILTNVMYMYGLDPMKDATVIADQLTKATLSANISMIDLAESLKYVGGDARSFGITVAETSALIGVLGNNGIQASMAGTALGNMLRYLTKSLTSPNYKGAKALAKIGLSPQDFVDAQGNFIELEQILQKLSAATQGLSESEYSFLVNEIFGVRGKRAADALLRDTSAYTKLLSEIENSTGYAESISEKRMNSLAGALEQMTSAWESVQIAFSKSLEPILVPIFKMVSNILGAFQNLLQSPVGTFIAAIAGIGTVLGMVGFKLMQFMATYKLATLDNTVTFSNMANSMTAGWGRASAAATNYAGILQYITALNEHGTLAGAGNVGMQAAMSSLPRGTMVGPYAFYGKYYKDGTPKLYTKANGRATQVSKKVSQSFMSSQAGRQGLARAMAGTTGAVSKLGGIMGSLGGFLMGPWGMALMIGLPLLITGINWLSSKLQNNSEETRKNTAAVNTLAHQHELDRQRKEARQWLTERGERIMLANALNRISQSLDNFDGRKFEVNVTTPKDRKWTTSNTHIVTNTTGT